MLRVLFALLALGVAADAANAQEAGEASSGPPTWYAQALARGDGGLSVTHFWSRGPWLRAEIVVSGHKIVTIVKGPTYYVWDDNTGRGLAIGRDPSAVSRDRPERRPFGNEYELLLGLGAELIRKENAGGREVGVFRLTDDFGRRELQATLDELHLPLRLEVYNRATTRRSTTDYVNWQRGIRVEDAFFTPDARLSLEAMDYATYARRTASEGPIAPVPILHGHLLSRQED